MINTVLLAEDDKGSAYLVKTVLQKHGYHVLWAANGLEALDIIAKHPVDVVVTDVVMPHMDGVDLYGELKKREDTQHLPIIIITDKQVFKDSFAALGVEHFVPKSSDIEVLLDKIKTINAALQKKEYRKILVSGTNHQVVEQMQRILVARKHLVATADNSLETLHKAFLMSPHVIFLDICMSDYAQTQEVVRSLRCFHFFHNAKIFTYAFLSPKEMTNADVQWHIIEDEAKVCNDIGATKFIGNFTQGSFLENIEEYIQ